MATIGAIAFKRGTATDRLIAAMERLSGELDVIPAQLPSKGHDPELRHALTVESIATWAERIADVLESKHTPEATDYSTLTIADLDALIAERKLTLPETGSGANGAVVKQDRVTLLEDFDKVNAEAAP